MNNYSFRANNSSPEPTFLKLNKPLVIKNRMGFQFVEDIKDHMVSKDYLSIKVPLLEALKLGKEEEGVTKAVPQTKVKLIPNCLINPDREFTVLVSPNPKLFEYASIGWEQFVGYTNIKTAPYLIARFDRSLTLSKLDYLIQLRLLR